jgi:hypothetical protein
MSFRNPITSLPGSAITGPINGSQLVNGSVASLALAAGSVTTNKLAAGSVTTAALAAGAITGQTITGGTVTGAEVRTAATGNRVDIVTGTRAGQQFGAVDFYTEVGADTPGSITAFGPVDGGQRDLQLTAPGNAALPAAPTIDLTYDSTAPKSLIALTADEISIGSGRLIGGPLALPLFGSDATSGAPVVFSALSLNGATVQTPPVLAGWSWSGFTGETGLRYWLDALGNVVVQGTAKRTGAGLAANTNSTLFTLPAGYIPSGGGRRPAYQSTSGGTFAWISVGAPGGGVVLSNPTACAVNDVFEFSITLPL